MTTEQDSNKTIGQMVGVLSHTFKVSQYKGGPSTQLSIKIDFTTATDSEIKNWLTSNRIIAGQRPWRDLSEDELLEMDGTTFIAQSIGQKVKSREEKVQALVNAGLPRKLAEFSIDNPAEFEKVVGGLSTEPVNEDGTDPGSMPEDEDRLDEYLGEDSNDN